MNNTGPLGFIMATIILPMSVLAQSSDSQCPGPGGQFINLQCVCGKVSKVSYDPVLQTCDATGNVSYTGEQVTVDFTFQPFNQDDGAIERSEFKSCHYDDGVNAAGLRHTSPIKWPILAQYGAADPTPYCFGQVTCIGPNNVQDTFPAACLKTNGLCDGAATCLRKEWETDDKSPSRIDPAAHAVEFKISATAKDHGY